MIILFLFWGETIFSHSIIFLKDLNSNLTTYTSIIFDNKLLFYVRIIESQNRKLFAWLSGCIIELLNLWDLILYSWFNRYL